MSLTAPSYYNTKQIAAYDAGVLAASKGKKARDNPFISRFEGISEEQLAWNMGWNEWIEDNITCKA